MNILWIKALHIFFVLTWMAGLFYLPRIFVYHAQSDNPSVHEQFKIMERRLWWFVTPFAGLALVFGVWLIAFYGVDWLRASLWLHIKLTLLIAVYGYHFYLYKLVKSFAQNQNKHSPRFYRFLNEAPVIIILGIVFLAVVKPF
ncbi:CopD family protein [Alteromonas sp. ASW11-130]|uniref:CopD family protein n=1 Tax=Alteromonas sp. ASW11-130 TaxID=3015775 RepID=UPI002241FA52|nr:CopD family protein [Alteromonas sp. ASW11-130]MCW8091717.1 CopD family protein [Alteromonas sp. ASW11-130]